MQLSLLFSFVGHAVAILIGLYGLPAIRKPPPVQALPIIVQIIEVGPNTNLPSAPVEPLLGTSPYFRPPVFP